MMVKPQSLVFSGYRICPPFSRKHNSQFGPCQMERYPCEIMDKITIILVNQYWRSAFCSGGKLAREGEREATHGSSLAEANPIDS